MAGMATEADFPARFFERQDESPDALFYQQPRFVAHIDDSTMAALTAFYEEFLPPQSRVLDLMSSWISHLPATRYAHVAGLGMNAAELAANKRLDAYVVQDLNEDSRLPYADGQFDRAVIAVSVQSSCGPSPSSRNCAEYSYEAGRWPSPCRSVASPRRPFSLSGRSRPAIVCSWCAPICIGPASPTLPSWIARHRRAIHCG